MAGLMYDYCSGLVSNQEQVMMMPVRYMVVRLSDLKSKTDKMHFKFLA